MPKEVLRCVLSSLGHVPHVGYSSIVVSVMCVPAMGWTELSMPAAVTLKRDQPLCASSTCLGMVETETVALRA